MVNSRLYNPQISMTPTMSYFLIGVGIVIIVLIITIILITYWMSKKIKNETNDVYKTIDENKKNVSKHFITVDRKLTESKKTLNETIEQKIQESTEHNSQKHITDTDIQEKINPLDTKLNSLDTKTKLTETNLDSHTKSPHISKSYVDDQFGTLDDLFKTLDEQYKQLNTNVEANSENISQLTLESDITELSNKIDTHDKDSKHLTTEQLDNLNLLDKFGSRLGKLEKTVAEISEEN